MEASPEEARVAFGRRIEVYVQRDLPHLADQKKEIAAVLCDPLWKDKIEGWFTALLAEREIRRRMEERLERDWPEAATRLRFNLGEPCDTSRQEKWGDEARWLIEEHLGPARSSSPDGLESIYFCPFSGQMWFSDHPRRAENGDVGPMRISIIFEAPKWDRPV